MRFIKTGRQGLLGSESVVRMDKELIENLVNPDDPTLKDIYEALPLIDVHSATVLLQNNILNMSQSEIATFHDVSRRRVRQLLNQALEEVRGLL